MQPDLPPVDYAVLLPQHTCLDCGSDHFLAALPAEEGWDVAVRCRCAKNGHVRRYSTEQTGFPTFDAAEVAISWLLHPPKVVGPEPGIRREKNVSWDSTHNVWNVSVMRSGRKFWVGNFKDHDEAVKARDNFLTEELEAA